MASRPTAGPSAAPSAVEGRTGLLEEDSTDWFTAWWEALSERVAVMRIRRSTG
jgi:hypothetical protein